MWCIAKIDDEYRKRMYDILDLYGQPYDPKKPVIGLDEKPKQLLGHGQKPVPMRPGREEKYDYEYIRNGNANIFVAVEPKAGKRIVQVTEQRTKKDFANFVSNIAHEYPDAAIIRIVLDNLNTHFKKSFTETFGEKQATKILKKFEFHYTPKHASWLNVAEIEIGAMDAECTGRRIPTKEKLEHETNAWCQERNKQQKKINWRFTHKDADKKMSKHYVK